MAMKEVLRDRLSSSVDGEELTEALVLIRTRAPDLESVRKLNCWACNIGDVNVVRRMPNLEVCSLTINKLTSLRDFAHCHNLQELYVRTNNIQHLSDIHYLKNLKKLRSLWLSENPCANRDNYRLAVLKVLPNLHKLDNVVVTGEEVTRAQTEGDDLPVPEDFSFSAVFRETALSSEDSTDDKRGKNASLSSEKWALPRQKRQQKKREEFWREKTGASGDSGGVKSGGEGSAQSGEDGGSGNMQSSSDSADGDDFYNTVSSSRNAAVGQEHEEEKVDNPDNDCDVNVDDKSKIDIPITRAKWALNIEIPHNKTSGMQDDLELEVENLDNMMESGKTDADNNYTDTVETGTNEVEENECSNSNDEKICQNDNDEVQDMFTESSKVEAESLKVSQSFNPLVFQEGHFNVRNSTDDSNSLLVSDKDLAHLLATSAFNTDVAKIEAVDSNTNAISDYDVQADGTKGDEPIFQDHLVYAVTPSFKATEQTDTPLLDNAKLEDTLDLLDSAEGQALKSKHATGVVQELETEMPDFTVQTAKSETSSFNPVTQSVSDGREPINWEEYNRMRVQLGVEPVNRIPITARSFSSEVMKARNTNILQAVLCLVKELDKDSLDIVATVVKARLDSV
ncbi:hypothetical protein BsWGS_25654 [Bradybaena similaris]